MSECRTTGDIKKKECSVSRQRTCIPAIFKKNQAILSLLKRKWDVRCFGKFNKTVCGNGNDVNWEMKWWTGVSDVHYEQNLNPTKILVCISQKCSKAVRKFIFYEGRKLSPQFSGDTPKWKFTLRSKILNISR